MSRPAESTIAEPSTEADAAGVKPRLAPPEISMVSAVFLGMAAR